MTPNPLALGMVSTPVMSIMALLRSVRVITCWYLPPLIWMKNLLVGVWLRHLHRLTNVLVIYNVASLLAIEESFLEGLSPSGSISTPKLLLFALVFLPWHSKWPLDVILVVLNFFENSCKVQLLGVELVHSSMCT